MAVPINYALEVLDNEFEKVVGLFSKDDWQFYKFGNGGPYKRYLTNLTQMGNEYDPIIFDRFGIHENNASFNKLIVLCLNSAQKNYQKEYKGINTFRRQLTRMKKQL